MLSVTILGSGTSHGVPMIGCHCAVCESADPRDKRTRPSIVIGMDGHNVLIDTSPELRLQMVAARIDTVEAVLYTHGHADHVHGIDDLRRFNEQLRYPVPVYGAPELLEELRQRFGYIFTHQYFGGGIPSLDLRPIDGPFELFGRRVVPVAVWHGRTPVLGYRIGGFAYVTDTSEIPDQSRALLAGLDVLVLDALRHEAHPTHFNFEQALAMVETLRPRRAYFTHLTHGAPHSELLEFFPDGVEPAYDGMRLEIAE